MPSEATLAPWNQSLWEFATAVYAEPSVELQSLALQDRDNANVNILLWSVWLAESDIFLSKDVLDDVTATVDAVSQISVNRLRGVRRDIKEIGGFTRVQSQMISKLILNAELAIEKVLLHRLQEMTLKFMEVMADPVNPVCLLDYLQRIGVEAAEEKSQAFIHACRSNSIA